MDKNNLTDLENSILNRLHYHIHRNEKIGIDLLSAECFTSKATIVKLAKKLGYSGYTEMRYSLMERHSRKFSVDCSALMTPSSDSELSRYVEMLCTMLHENCKNKLYLDSIGICDAAKEYYYQRLLMFGFDVVMSYHFSTFHIPNPGLFFFMSFSGSRPEMLEKVRVANDCGFTTISLTTSAQSPVAQNARCSIEIEGIRTFPYNYLPNLFTANIIALLELTLSLYSERYLKNNL